MKKIITVVLTLILTISTVAGCTGSTPDTVYGSIERTDRDGDCKHAGHGGQI